MGVCSVVGGDLSVTESCVAGSVTPAVVCSGAGWLGGGVATRTSWVGGGAVAPVVGGRAGVLLEGSAMSASKGALQERQEVILVRKMSK